MINKLLVPFLLLLNTFLFAQNNQSPYSSYGLGERGGVDHSIFSALGNNSVAMVAPNILNVYNPASYSYIRNQFPLFSLGVSSRISTFEANGTTEKSSKTSINELALGISFAKRFGIAFGLTPFYSRGYSFTENVEINSDGNAIPIQYDYIGSGDINRAFFGVSAQILKFDSLTWAVGANLSSVFGTVNNERRSQLVSTGSSASGIHYSTTRIKSFHYEIGTVLTKQFPKGHSVTLAGTFEPLQSLTAYENEQLFFSLDSPDDPNSYDLISQSGEAKGKITIAPSYTAGFDYSYRFKATSKSGKVRNSELKLLGSYNGTDWTKFEREFRDSTSNPAYPSTSSFNVGLQYRPECNLFSGSVSPKFFERMSYRVGYYTKTLPYTFNGAQLSEFGTSFGLGIPILTEKTESSVQIGITYGKRGTTEVGSLNESFIGLNFGIIIAPSISDRWFIKRKLD